MTAPDFTFNEKTGELSRGGKLIALCRLHAQMFAGLLRNRDKGPVATKILADEIRLTHWALEHELSALRYRLAPLGIRIATKHGGKGAGRFLVFGPVPKWAPKIPPEQAPAVGER